MRKAEIANPAENLKPLLEQSPIAVGMFPLMEDEEFNAFVADIRANGLHDSIILYEDKILDGINRERARRVLGIEPNYQEVEDYFDEPVTDAIARVFVISVNAHRRHLTPEAKRKAVEDLIKASPEKSDRAIAKATGVSHTHASKLRRELEKIGDVATVATSTDTKGRKQPRQRVSHSAAAKRAEATAPRRAATTTALQDVGPVSSGETDRLRARNEELGNENHRLKSEIVGLKSEIKDLQDGRKPKLATSDPKGTLYCSFCDKSQHEVRKLIAGPKVFICNECTALCADIVRKDDEVAVAPEVKQSKAKASPTPAENPYFIPPDLDRTNKLTAGEVKAIARGINRANQ